MKLRRLEKQIISVIPMILICSTLNAQSAFAQSLEITATLGNQDIWGSYIPIDLSIFPQSSVGQVKVQWIVPYGVKALDGENTNYQANLASNSTFSDHLVLDPQYPGIYPVTANVSGIYNGVPFDKSATITLHIDQNLHLTDNEGAYDIKKGIYIVGIIATGIFALLLLKTTFLYFKKRFLDWLHKE